MTDNDRLVRIWQISLALEDMARKLKLPDMFEFAVAVKFLANMPDHFLANNMENLDATDKKAKEAVFLDDITASGHSAAPAEK